MRGASLLAAVVLLALAGCAPTPPPGAPATGGTEASADRTSPATPAAATPEATVPASPEPPAASAVTPESTPPVEPSAAPEAKTGAAPTAPSLACRSDSDCAVKDVGSCCGYRPACVNADAETHPEQVKARCAAEGRMGICGFQPVSGCQCVAGQCAALPETIGPAPPQALQ
jgi:hypothetical protein